MRSIIILLLSVLAAVSVSAAPFSQKQWLSRRDLNIHIDWPGSGGASESDEQHDSRRWPLSLFSSSRRWPFSDHYSTSSPSPTLQHQKRSYLEHEKRAMSTGTCDLQNAIQYMDLSAVSPALPSPSGLTLFQVAIGRGTQNYTCDLSNDTAIPVAIGAVATLFNFSCVAAQQPALLKKIPQIALNLPVPTENNTNSKILDAMTSGHHYFVNNYTTPFFNLDTSAHQYGQGAVAKANASNAPSGAISGQHGTTGYGAVQWLKLNQMQYAQDNWKAVYRLNTAGGNAPKTCSGQPAAFEIEYAAEYWLFT